MLRSRTAILGLSSVAAFAGWSMARSYVASAGQTVPVLVATEDIPPYYTFQPGDPKVTVAQVPKLAVRRDVFTDPSLLSGRTTRSVIPAGTPIARPYLAGESDAKGGSLAKALRDARRNAALSWRFPAADAVAGRVAAGDIVDVLLAGGDKGQPAIKQILNVRVFDVVKPDEKQGATPAAGGDIVVIFEEPNPSLLEALAQARVQGWAAYLRLRPAEGTPAKTTETGAGAR